MEHTKDKRLLVSTDHDYDALLLGFFALVGFLSFFLAGRGSGGGVGVYRGGGVIAACFLPPLPPPPPPVHFRK